MQDNLYGVYRAVVVGTNDPTNKRRVRVKAPQVSGNAELQWAEPANPASPVPSVNTIVWVMFNGGYINKPIYFPSEEDLKWTKPTLETGFGHNGNSGGDAKWTTYTFRGTRYMEWQGSVTVATTGSAGAFVLPNGGTFYTFTDPKLIPSVRRTISTAQNYYVTTPSVKIDFNTTGTCRVIGSADVNTTYVMLNNVRYVLD